jgi:hypothetical protein
VYSRTFVFVITILVLSVTAMTAVSAQETNRDLEFENDVTVGEQTTITYVIKINETPVEDDADIEATLFVDGRSIQTKTKTEQIYDGAEIRIHFPHTFNSGGIRDVRVESTTQILGQQVEGSAEDTVSVAVESSTTRITDVVPKQEADTASGIHDIEVGETMVVRGETNLDPSETAIAVEVAQVPSTAEFFTDVANDWGSDGIWTAELEVPEDFALGQYTILADDGERTDSVDVNIVEAEQPAELEVFSADLPDEAQPGERITIDGTIRNTGELNSQQTVSYKFDNTIVSTDTVTLQGGQTEDVTFSYTIPSSTNEGTYTHGIYTDDNSITPSIQITIPQKPAELEVSDFDLPGEAEPGETVNVEAQIENVGDESANRYIEYRFDGQTKDRERVTLDGGETGTVDFSYTIPSSTDGGNYEQSIHTGDYTTRRSVSVQQSNQETTEQTQGTSQTTGRPGNQDEAGEESGLLTTPNWGERNLLPGGASVPVDNLNDPTTLTVLGIVISVLGMVIQLTMMRV